MSKPALGRGLGSLLSSRHVDSTAPAPSTTRVTPGVATLISGNQRTAGVSPIEDASVRQAAKLDVRTVARTTRLRWMLVAADVALCGMATVLLLRSPKLRPEEIALCIAAVLLGAWLACGAWMLGRDPQN
ncbi:MAG: hypothetical protein IPK15_17520 [Verrucomicrobia bacterium]|nr:hypothetical protein [Verrucomicrobiota bacterium]